MVPPGGTFACWGLFKGAPGQQHTSQVRDQVLLFPLTRPLLTQVTPDVEWGNVLTTDGSKYSGSNMAKLKHKHLLSSQLEQDTVSGRPEPGKSPWPQHQPLLHPTGPTEPMKEWKPTLLPSAQGHVSTQATEQASAAVQAGTVPASATGGAVEASVPALSGLAAMLPVLEAVAGFVDKVHSCSCPCACPLAVCWGFAL